MGLTAKEGLIERYQGLHDWLTLRCSSDVTIRLFRLCISLLAQCLTSASQPTVGSGMAFWIEPLWCVVRGYMLYYNDRCNHSQRLGYNKDYKVPKLCQWQWLFLTLHVEVPHKLGLFWTETLQCELSIHTRLGQENTTQSAYGVSPINCLYRLAQEKLYVCIWKHHQWLVYMCTSSKTSTIRYCSFNRTDI